MNNYERIRAMTINDMAEFFDDKWSYDYDPAIEWWDDTYCSKCESVKRYVDVVDREMDFAWCEVNGVCKYFPELDEVPNRKRIMKLWLESEV